MYKNQVSGMLYQHVFPVFQSPHGHLRARVCISFFVIEYLFEQFSILLGLLVYNTYM